MKYNEISDEIIKRVNENNIPLEDGEFTINGVVYRTVEIVGDWKCCHFGLSYDTFRRIVVCEIFKEDISLDMFLAQYQEKDGTRKYEYDKCISVKRQTEEFVLEGWVKA